METTSADEEIGPTRTASPAIARPEVELTTWMNIWLTPTKLCGPPELFGSTAKTTDARTAIVMNATTATAVETIAKKENAVPKMSLSE